MNNDLLSPLEWYTVQRKVSELIPCDFNPRDITDEELEKLTESLKKFNLVEIPAIDIDNTLLAGHQRIASMFILGRVMSLLMLEFQTGNYQNLSLRNICYVPIFITEHLIGIR